LQPNPRKASLRKGQFSEKLAIAGGALLRIAALYKVEDAIRGSDPDRRRAGRQELSLPLEDEFFARAFCPGHTRVAQIRSGRGYGLYAETPGRLSRSGAFAAPLAPRSPSILDDGRVGMD